MGTLANRAFANFDMARRQVSPRQDSDGAGIPEVWAEVVGTPTTSVQPDGTVSVTVRVYNSFSWIYDDPDYCTPNILEQDGLKTRGIVTVAGEQIAEMVECISAGWGQNYADFEFQFQAPSTGGEYTMAFTFSGAESGTFWESLSLDLTVTEESDAGECPVGTELDPATGECVPIDDGGGGGGDDGLWGGGGDGGSGDSPLGQVEQRFATLGAGILIFMLLFAAINLSG